jgi:chorismate mutase
MDQVEFQSVLSDLRAELDNLDTRLVMLLKERADVIARVIQRKRAARLGPVDATREDEMLSRIAAQAESVGLDQRIATQVLRAVIEAFTVLEAASLDNEAS